MMIWEGWSFRRRFAEPYAFVKEDPLEIFVDRDGKVILKKYSPIGELGDFAKEYADALYESLNHITLITDRDHVIAVSGGSKKDYMEKGTGP